MILEDAPCYSEQSASQDALLIPKKPENYKYSSGYRINSHSQRLNVLGFLSRQGTLIYHSTVKTITTEVVIEAFDRLIAQKAHGIRFIAITDRDALAQARNEHQLMIEAIRDEDHERLTDLCRQHLLPSQNRYLELYAGTKE